MFQYISLWSIWKLQFWYAKNEHIHKTLHDKVLAILLLILNIFSAKISKLFTMTKYLLLTLNTSKNEQLFWNLEVNIFSNMELSQKLMGNPFKRNTKKVTSHLLWQYCWNLWNILVNLFQSKKLLQKFNANSMYI